MLKKNPKRLISPNFNSAITDPERKEKKKFFKVKNLTQKEGMLKYFAAKPKSIGFLHARDHNAFGQTHETKLVVMKGLCNMLQSCESHQ